MKPYLVYIFRFDSTTEKNIEKIAQFFYKKKNQNKGQILVKTLNEKVAYEADSKNRSHLLIHFLVGIKKKDSIIHQDILILYYAAADDIGEKVNGYLLNLCRTKFELKNLF